MGIKTFIHELKAKVSASRLFKATITHSSEIVPKAFPHIKSIEVVGGGPIVSGCILKGTFADGKHMKSKVESVDAVNLSVKYVMLEGEQIGDKIEKICTDVKFEESADGVCVLKFKNEYHTKGDYELSDEDAKQDSDRALVLYKACDDYLVANPHACA